MDARGAGPLSAKKHPPLTENYRAFELVGAKSRDGVMFARFDYIEEARGVQIPFPRPAVILIIRGDDQFAAISVLTR